MADISAANAGTVKIGDLEVNRIGLGTNRISDNDKSRAVLKRAVELGINFIDTAQLYGQSQEIIGQTLAPYAPGVVIATKGGYTTNDLKSLGEAIDESLSLLMLDQIKLWHLHRVHNDNPLPDTMRFLKEQMQAGKIRNIGLSEVSIDQIETALQIVPIATVQNRYNLNDRSHEAVLDYCTKQNIVFIPFFPLGGGSAAQDKKLNQLAAKYSATPIQIALAWLLKRSPITLPIPGTLSTEHLQSNLVAADIDLSQADFDSLG